MALSESKNNPIMDFAALMLPIPYLCRKKIKTAHAHD